MPALLSDLHDATRSLRRDPAFTAIVSLTLAVTVGTTTAVFSIVNGVLLKPLGYSDPERLVTLREVWHEFADRAPTLAVNERHFEYWRAKATGFAAMAQYLPLPANLTAAGEATQVSAARTSGSLFEVLGVSAALGRALRPDDEERGRPEVAVMSHALWQTRFGGSPSVIGTGIVLDGRPYTVVGVPPPGFRLPVSGQLIPNVDVFVPLRVEVGWVGDHNNLAIGRLRPGASVEQASAELQVLQQQVSAIATRESGERVTLSAVIAPLDESIVGRARRGLLLLLAAIGSVLLIACANLANLSLSRALSGLREGAIRAALGASRGRLIRRVVFEQVILAAVGAAMGLWIAFVSLGAFVRTAPVDLPRLEDVALDGRVAVFAAAVALAAALLVSALPAWHLALHDVQSMMRAGGAAAGGDRKGSRARSALTALQVAVSVTLLAVTGLVGLSLARVLRVEYGFNPSRLIAVPIAMPTVRYDDDAIRVATYDRILAEVSGIPGIRAVSPTSMLPLLGSGQATSSSRTARRGRGPSSRAPTFASSRRSSSRRSSCRCGVGARLPMPNATRRARRRR